MLIRGSFLLRLLHKVTFKEALHAPLIAKVYGKPLGRRLFLFSCLAHLKHLLVVPVRTLHWQFRLSPLVQLCFRNTFLLVWSLALASASMQVVWAFIWYYCEHVFDPAGWRACATRRLWSLCFGEDWSVTLALGIGSAPIAATIVVAATIRRVFPIRIEIGRHGRLWRHFIFIIWNEVVACKVHEAIGCSIFVLHQASSATTDTIECELTCRILVLDLVGALDVRERVQFVWLTTRGELLMQVLSIEKNDWIVHAFSDLNRCHDVLRLIGINFAIVENG